MQVQSEGSVWGKDHDALARLVGKVSLNIKAMGGLASWATAGTLGAQTRWWRWREPDGDPMPYGVVEEKCM